MLDIKNKKIGILGIARSGVAAAYKAKELGATVFLSDSKPKNQIADIENIEKDFECEFGGHSAKLFDNDLIIVSPGIPLSVPIIKKLQKENKKIIGEIEFGYLVKNSKSKILAVTGSNGKSTTVTLLAHILKESGYNTVLAGNIGKAFTSFPIEKSEIDYIVLELSSFQLELIDKFRANSASVLNITPDHLNRYASMKDYAVAKMNIFKNQTADDISIYNADDKMIYDNLPILKSKTLKFSLKSKADAFWQNEKIFTPIGEIANNNPNLQGPHNVMNIMAAVLMLRQTGINKEEIEKAISTFTPLPHRLEFVKDINGIKFYNDSKATNTDAVKYALKSFGKNVRIILGGSDKGEDYSILNNDLLNHAKKIYLIGATQRKMESDFKDILSQIDYEKFSDFSTTIKKAYSDSKKGDVILLSPACASYDMFANFEQRGNIFKEVVRGIKDV